MRSLIPGTLSWAALSVALALGPVATAEMMPAALPGLLESGTPSTLVQTPELLGMNSFPVDLVHLPDGRMVIASPLEIVIGDGIRWDVYRRADDGLEQTSGRIVCDQSGQLYVAVRGGVARVILLSDGRWTIERLFNLLPKGESPGVFLNANVRVGREIYWYGTGGAVVSWRPGEGLREIAKVAVTDLVFAVGEKLFVANWGRQGLLAIEGDQLNPVENNLDLDPSASVSAAVRLDEKTALVAVHPGGLRLFDGKTFKLFTDAPWAQGNRISALVAVGEGEFAAAVDGEGIFYFDATGQVLQALDRTSDPRFARVQRMISTENGVVWVLLNEGVARVNFPSQLTRFDQNVVAGLQFASPVRWQGRLWLQADGRAERGVYDETGRLIRFASDTPEKGFVFKLAAPGGHLLAGTDAGLYERREQGWLRVVPDLINARVELPPDEVGRFWYVAKGEVGWLRRSAQGDWTRQRWLYPEIKDAFSLERDRGMLWLELGGSRIARVRLEGDAPAVDFYGLGEGLPEGWAQIFRTRDGMRVLLGGKTYRLDEMARRFVLDTEFMTANPWVVGAIGRPAMDAKGRQWFSNIAYSRVLEPDGQGGMRTVFTSPPGITPYAFVTEEDGVVWLGQRGRLMRFDPRFEATRRQATHALITRVEFPGQRGPTVAPRGDLGELPFAENSPTFFYMAPGHPFSAPATFEFKLQGGENRWISTGATGVAAFHELYEGKYTFQVRPVVAGLPQDTVSLSFTVLPPWYRHSLAYFAYGLVLVGTIGGVSSVLTLLQRREKKRLEKLVVERTQAVQAANRQLAQQVSETLTKSNELRLSEERYRALYDFNPAMYFTLAPNGQINSVNDYGAQQLGYRPGELIGRPVQDIIAPSDHDLHEEVSRRCLLEPGRVFTWQLRKVARNGTEMHVKEIARSVRQTDGNLMLFVVCEDISATVKLEDQLRQAQKMEAVGQLAGGVAHDFNNLLTVIQGQAEWAQHYAVSEEEKKEGLQQIRHAAEQATKLTRQLLVFSRRQTMQVEAADLNQVVAKVIRMLARLIGEDIKIETRFARERSMTRIDAGMIEQVLVNLALNARDAMPNGGRIVIDVSPCFEGPERVAGRPGCQPGNYFCILFSDTGVGISPEVLPRIFEPFYTTKAPGQGTGLGLATSASILSQHHGWMEVESVMLSGTTFRLYLPENESPARATVLPVAAAAELAGRARVLLVEDEPAVRLVAKRLLEKFGYRVTECTNADEALACWSARPDDFDVLLTDILMPGTMNGRQLAERLHAERPDLAICLMTGHDPAMLARKDGQPQLQAPHLLKPFTRETLLAALEKVLPKGGA